MTHSTLRAGAIAALAGALLLAACNANAGGGSSASAAASPSTAASAAAAGLQITVASTPAGMALAGPDGKTLYMYAKDTAGTSTCTGDCATNWPPLVLTGSQTATAGSGVQASLLGSITRPDGTKQVTYANHPLYNYAADTAAGQSNGQGVLGLWSIATPSGAMSSGSAAPSSSLKGY